MTRAARVTIASTLALVALIGGFVAWRLSVASSTPARPAAATQDLATPAPPPPAPPARPPDVTPSQPPPSDPRSSVPAASSREVQAGPRGSGLAPALPASEPAPPPYPFAAGEELRYQVYWSGGGSMSLPAGEAVFRVEPGASRAGARPGFRFELTITTASWISAFFEARDRFWSLTGPDLTPATHVQELNEGRRHATRTMTFDRPRQLVLVSSGSPDAVQDTVEFPWVPGVRDPLGAFYQARLITIGPAARLSLPVNNVGHALTLVLGAAERTSLTAEGRTQPALLLDARLDEAGSQEPNPSARVWLSTDDRRIPLAIDVSGSFGTFRAEIASYRRSAPAPGA